MDQRSLTSTNPTNSPINPELLAPAGSLECFHAAIEAGADAVYLGLDNHNARLRAKNVTIKTLSYMVPYAHKRKVKVYIAFNTIIKQCELKNAIDLLSQLEQIKVDALIISDLGLLDISHSNFPNLNLHASTQMAVHNENGVKAVQKLGIKRAILARELSLVEIEKIKKSCHLELEIFIHGALCYSISGMCLASSYLGGQSGNRGRCTQVCRRLFSGPQKSAFYFSLKDLCALNYLKALTEMGITSFKIEGRMKSAEYVFEVVSAYRQYIDNPSKIGQAKKLLEQDMGRKKTAFFFPPSPRENMLVSSPASGTGIYLGKINTISPANFEIKTRFELHEGDKIRIQEHNNRPVGLSCRIIKVLKGKQFLKIFINNNPGIHAGDHVYLIQKKPKIKPAWRNCTINVKPHTYDQKNRLISRIMKKYSPPRKSKSLPQNEDRLYIKMNSIGWLNLLKTTTCDGLILQGNMHDLEFIKKSKKIQKSLKSKLILALPPFIAQNDLSEWKKEINELNALGFRKWMCGHFSQKELMPSGSCLYTDYTIWCVNRATQNMLIKNGFHFFSYSPEDDFFNLKELASESGFTPLFSSIPLFISRVDPSLGTNSRLKENRNQTFTLKKNNNLYYLIGDQPLCLFHRREKIKAQGINNFLIDLSFFPENKKNLQTLLKCYAKKEKIPQTMVFNHKLGLK